MTFPIPSSRISDRIWSAYRTRCHRFLAIAYKEALPRILTEPDEETDITGYLCEALEDWFRKNPKESTCFYIKDDPPLGQSKKTGKRRPRTDIIIGFAAGNRPEFYIEAKRLHHTKARAAKYTGVNGMGCFISGRYAKCYHEVAMLGYVQTDDIDYWRIKLRTHIKSKLSELQLMVFDETASFSDSFPQEWATTHHRDGLPSIRIFHILINCIQSSAN